MTIVGLFTISLLADRKSLDKTLIYILVSLSLGFILALVYVLVSASISKEHYKKLINGLCNFILMY